MIGGLEGKAMPYADPEKRREAQRRRREKKRGISSPTPPDTPDAPPLRRPVVAIPLRTPHDVLAALEEALNAARADPIAGPQTTARTVGYLLAIGLKAIELSTIAARVEELERVLRRRKEQ
jgi:hypothetical protein